MGLRTLGKGILEMKLPPFIHPGDKVIAVAPSFGVTSEPYLTRYQIARKNWERRGYFVEEGPCVHLEEGVASSASPEKRAEEIMGAFRGDASLILSVGGGETMCDILPYIDFEEISKLPPKWFMGFSDNTNLTFPLATLSSLITVYGPCFPQYFHKPYRLAEKDALDLLEGRTAHVEGYPKYSITRSNPDHPLWTYRCTQKKVITPINGEEPMRGTLLGGCLDCLINICGTEFDRVKEFIAKEKEGVIWFLEACDLSPLGIRRALFQLIHAGWFASAKGFLIGRPLCKDAEICGVNKHSAVSDMLSSFGVPIWMDVDLGHISPSMPILCGAKATVSLIEGNLIIDYDGKGSIPEEKRV